MKIATYHVSETAERDLLRAGSDPHGGLSRLVWEGAYANIFIVLTDGAFLARLLTARLIASFHEPREMRLPVVIQLMGYAVLKRMSIGRQVFPFAAEVASSQNKHGHRDSGL